MLFELNNWLSVRSKCFQKCLGVENLYCSIWNIISGWIKLPWMESGCELDFSGELNVELNAKTSERRMCKLVISIKTGSFQYLTNWSLLREATNAETLAGHIAWWGLGMKDVCIWEDFLEEVTLNTDYSDTFVYVTVWLMSSFPISRGSMGVGPTTALLNPISQVLTVSSQHVL